MKFAIFTAAAVILILLVGLLIVRRFYRIAFIRERDKSPDASVVGVPWASLVDRIEEGAEWFFSHITQQVRVKSYDGLELVGYLVEHPKARGTMIMCHGYRSFCHVDFSCSFEFYYNLGLNLLVIDQRSHGNSEGEVITFGIKERFDVNRWAHFVRDTFGADHPIVLAGVSMGCSTVLMSIATGLPENIKGIVADCGYTSAWEQLKYITRRDYHLPPWPVLNILNAYFKHKTGCDLREASTLTALENNTLPVMFIHGGADRFVPTDFTRENYKACSADRRLFLAESAAHAVSYLAETERYQREATDFINSIL